MLLKERYFYKNYFTINLNELKNSCSSENIKRRLTKSSELIQQHQITYTKKIVLLKRYVVYVKL